MLKPIQLLVVSTVLVFTTICFAGETDNDENSTRVVFLYNNREYPSSLLEKTPDDQSIPSKLRENAQPGNSIGYRRYKGTEIIEDISGSVTADEQVIFSNGVGFSAKNKTIFEILQKIKSIIILLHTPNYGYLE